MKLKQTYQAYRDSQFERLSITDEFEQTEIDESLMKAGGETVFR